jgi:aconitate hydratase
MQNLINFGILPLTFVNPADLDDIDQGDTLEIREARSISPNSKALAVVNRSKNHEYQTVHSMTARQTEMVLEGGMINVMRRKIENPGNSAR